MSRDVCADAWLVEGIDIAVAAIEHAVQFEDVAVGFCPTELVARSLAESAWITEPVPYHERRSIE